MDQQGKGPLRIALGKSRLKRSAEFATKLGPYLIFRLISEDQNLHQNLSHAAFIHHEPGRVHALWARLVMMQGWGRVNVWCGLFFENCDSLNEVQLGAVSIKDGDFVTWLWAFRDIGSHGSVDKSCEQGGDAEVLFCGSIRFRLVQLGIISGQLFWRMLSSFGYPVDSWCVATVELLRRLISCFGLLATYLNANGAKDSQPQLESNQPL
jgi:hypothetical protein